MMRRDFALCFHLYSKQSCGKKSILIEFVSNATVSYLLLCIHRRVLVPQKQEMCLQVLLASKTLIKQLWRRTDLHLHHGPLWLFIKTVKSTPAQSHLYLYYISDIYIKLQVLIHLTFTSYIRWILGPVRTEIGEWVGRVSNLGFLSYSWAIVNFLLFVRVVPSRSLVAMCVWFTTMSRWAACVKLTSTWFPGSTFSPHMLNCHDRIRVINFSCCSWHVCMHDFDLEFESGGANCSDFLLLGSFIYTTSCSETVIFDDFFKSLKRPVWPFKIKASITPIHACIDSLWVLQLPPRVQRRCFSALVLW